MTDFVDITCPTLPSASLLKEEMKNKWKQQILSVLAECVETTRQRNSFPDPKMFQDALAMIQVDCQAQVCSDILFSLFSTSIIQRTVSSELPQLTLAASNLMSFTLETKIKILLLLKLCPNAAKIADSQGNLLIHYVVLMEFPDRDLMRFLCHAYPTSVSRYFQSPDQGQITPFHCILLKNEVDFELALFVMLIMPRVARDEIHGKLPLHLAMTSFIDDDVSADFQVKLIKKLLAECPAAAFKEVSEEVRHLRLSNLQNAEDQGITSQQFQMQVQIKRWTPVERVHQSSDEKMKSVFHKFVEHIGIRHLRSEIRRYK